MIIMLRAPSAAEAASTDTVGLPRHLRISLAIVLPVVCLCASPSRAAVPAAYTYLSAPESAQGQLTLGFTFTANADFVVNSLGFYDSLGDGFLTAHQVGIYAGDGAAGEGPLLAFTTLAAGQSGVLGANNFRYKAITPLTLTTGQTYTIAGLSPNYNTQNDAFVYGGLTEIAGLGISPLISIGTDAARYVYNTPSLDDPSLHVGDYQIYAVNFAGPTLFSSPVLPVVIPGVPEPVTWALLMTGFGLVGSAARARRYKGAMVAA